MKLKNARDADFTNDIDGMLDTLRVQKVERRYSVGGAWVHGTIADYHFEALVFPQSAKNRSWEVDSDSRISKLSLQRIKNGTTMFRWDRGSDIGAQTNIADEIVSILAAGLADVVWSGSESRE